MAVMESTTLITFMLQHAAARKVELLGSWDNFTEAYPMEMDRRRGRGFWSGCHSFRNIICDGDLSHVHEKRAGGLKMGGTYWYFYRIDADEEFHDPTQQTTTSCPLLPGQILNVLEVPFDTEKFTCHSRSSSVSISNTVIQTLNPEDRYLTPRPAPKPKLPKLATSAEAAPSSRHIPIAPGSAGGRDRPWSAYSAGSHAWNSNRPIRKVKSASASPISPTGLLRTAIAQLKTPTSALTPSQGGRGRSRVLRTEGLRSERTRSRSSELKSRISRPMTMDSPQLADWQSSNSLEMVVVSQPRLLVEKRVSSPHYSVRRLQESESPEVIIDDFPLPPGHYTSPSTVQSSRIGRTSDRRGFSDSYTTRRSSSANKRREPSPLRNLAMTQDQIKALDNLAIPSCVPELQLEDAMSPHKSSSLDMKMAAPETHTADTLMDFASNDQSANADLDKALPPLPLFARNDFNEMERALEALNNQFAHDRQFSPWGTELNIPLPESPEFLNEASSETGSMTFSSIKDGSTVSTPYRSSTTKQWPLIDNVALQYEHEREDLFQFQLDNFVNRRLAELTLRSAGTGTESTTSTAMPYQLPGTNPFAQVEKARMRRDSGQRDEPNAPSINPVTRQLSHTEQLLDEFEYLGAALL